MKNRPSNGIDQVEVTKAFGRLDGGDGGEMRVQVCSSPNERCQLRLGTRGQEGRADICTSPFGHRALVRTKQQVRLEKRRCLERTLRRTEETSKLPALRRPQRR
jgi:hypothetical protein